MLVQLRAMQERRAIERLSDETGVELGQLDADGLNKRCEQILQAAQVHIS